MSYYEDDENLKSELQEFLREDPIFATDPVLGEAFREFDTALHVQNVPPGKTRFRHVADRLRAAYPEKFYDVPNRKLTWSEIPDPVERREAKKAFEDLKERFKYSDHKVTEEQYLKTYLEK